MTDSHTVTIWDGLTLGLWSLFFLIGLAPEVMFHGFRMVSGVTTQGAFVNSSAAITVGFSIYLAFFVSRQCRVAGLSDADAQGKAIQVGILGMLAFLELPSRSLVFGTQTIVVLMVQATEMNDVYLRNVIWVVGCSKIIAWLYLYSLVFRFHLMGRRHVFSRMPTFFAARPHVAHNGTNHSKPPSTESRE